MAIGAMTATSSVVFPTAPALAQPKPSAKALGRVKKGGSSITGSLGLRGVKPAPVALGRVTSRTIPGTMGIGLRPSPGYATPIKPPPDAGAGCVEPPSDRTLTDGRPHRDPALVSLYLACVDRKRASSSPPIVAGSPVMVPAGIVPTSSAPNLPPSNYAAPSYYDEAPSFASPVAASPPPPPAIVASEFGDVRAAKQGQTVVIVAGVALLGVLGFVLHKKGVF